MFITCGIIGFCCCQLPTANSQQATGNWQRGQPTDKGATDNVQPLAGTCKQHPLPLLPLSAMASVRPTPLGAIKRGIIFAHNCINNALFSVDFIPQSVCVFVCVCVDDYSLFFFYS